MGSFNNQNIRIHSLLNIKINNVEYTEKTMDRIKGGRFMSKKMDRRQKKTRKAILDACFSLIQEKDIQQVTINEIAEQANINRGTFYLHFDDKYDMMNSYENEMISKIEEVIVKNIPKEQFNQHFLPSRYDTIVQILKCYDENNMLMQLLLKSSHRASFQAKLQETIKVIINTEIPEQLKYLNYDIPMELLVIAFTSVTLSIAEYSYQAKEPINIEQLAEFMFKIILQGPVKTMGLIKNNRD